MLIYIHVDDLLLRALLEQRKEGSSHPLYANHIDIEDLCQLIKLHILDRAIGLTTNSGIVNENIKRLAVQLGLHSFNSLLDAGGIVDRGRDRIKAIGIFLLELFDAIRLDVASDGEDFGDLGSW